MNPNDNNPITPSGAMGAGVTPTPNSPLDFTNPDNLNTNTSSLSMSDSLASAQDSLTSAGQAAPSMSSTIGLDQLGMDKPSASMDAPMQPLTPAAPVPGSIGSVTSGSPVSAADNLGSNATMPPVNTAPSAPNPTPVTTSNMPSMGGSATAGNSTAGGAAGNSGRSYFNPFASNSANSSTTSAPSAPAMPSSTPTSSTNVPPALQPQGEKFSDRLAGTAKPKSDGGQGGSKLMTVLGWALAALFAVSTVVLFILWQQADAASKEKEIIYVERDPVEETLSMLNCSQNIGADEGLGLEGLTWHNRDMSASFKNSVLSSITLFDTYTFENAELAANSGWYFDDLSNNYANMAANLGVENLVVSGEVNDVVRTYNIGANSDQLVGDFVGVYMLNMGEDGAVADDLASVKQAYENAGFVCTEE